MAESGAQEFSTPSITSPLLHQEKSDSNPNFFARMVRKYTGFTKTYSIVLFFLTAGLFATFCIARLPHLNLEEWSKKASPGEWYWFREGLSRIGMTMHLWSVLRA
jgi:hypothetical protein